MWNKVIFLDDKNREREIAFFLDNMKLNQILLIRKILS